MGQFPEKQTNKQKTSDNLAVGYEIQEQHIICLIFLRSFRFFFFLFSLYPSFVVAVVVVVVVVVVLLLFLT